MKLGDGSLDRLIAEKPAEESNAFFTANVISIPEDIAGRVLRVVRYRIINTRHTIAADHDFASGAYTADRFDHLGHDGGIDAHELYPDVVVIVFEFVLKLLYVRMFENGGPGIDILGDQIQGPAVRVGGKGEYPLTPRQAGAEEVQRILSPGQGIRAVRGRQQYLGHVSVVLLIV
jgi:hypothetical protein